MHQHCLKTAEPCRKPLRRAQLTIPTEKNVYVLDIGGGSKNYTTHASTLGSQNAMQSRVETGHRHLPKEHCRYVNVLLSD